MRKTAALLLAVACALSGSLTAQEGLDSILEGPVCSYCKKPLLGGFIVLEDKKYHKACYEDHVALRCSLCGGMVEGRYLYDHWGNVYHDDHERTVPRCAYCLRFISEKLTGGGVEHQDGRRVCAICRRTAVEDLGAAMALLDEVRGRLSDLGLGTGDERIRLLLVDLGEMQKLAGSRSHTLRGYTHHEEITVGQGVVQTRRADIYLLVGMPRMEAIATLAHELTHVWQFLQGRTDNDEAFREGSCNYAAWLVLKSYPGEESAYVADAIASSPDRVYGEGFRRVKRFAEDRGASAWIERLRTRDSLPAGY